MVQLVKKRFNPSGRGLGTRYDAHEAQEVYAKKKEIIICRDRGAREKNSVRVIRGILRCLRHTCSLQSVKKE